MLSDPPSPHQHLLQQEEVQGGSCSFVLAPGGPPPPPPSPNTTTTTNPPSPKSSKVKIPQSECWEMFEPLEVQLIGGFSRFRFQQRPFPPSLLIWSRWNKRKTWKKINPNKTKQRPDWEFHVWVPTARGRSWSSLPWCRCSYGRWNLEGEEKDAKVVNTWTKMTRANYSRLYCAQAWPGVNPALFMNLHLRTLELVELFADGRLKQDVGRERRRGGFVGQWKSDKTQKKLTREHLSNAWL